MKRVLAEAARAGFPLAVVLGLLLPRNDFFTLTLSGAWAVPIAYALLVIAVANLVISWRD